MAVDSTKPTKQKHPSTKEDAYLLGTRKHRGGRAWLWLALVLFFTGLTLWGLFWGIPEIADVTTNLPVAYLIGRVSGQPFSHALAFTYLVMGWACAAVGILGLATLIGAHRAKEQVKRDIGKARHIHPIKGGKHHKHAIHGWW